MPTLLRGLTVTGGKPPDVFKRIFPPSFPDMALRRPSWSFFWCNWTAIPKRLAGGARHVGPGATHREFTQCGVSRDRADFCAVFDDLWAACECRSPRSAAMATNRPLGSPRLTFVRASRWRRLTRCFVSSAWRANLPGEDANPYLTLALLVTGLLGMQQQLEPSAALNARAANPRVTGSIAVEAAKTKKPRCSHRGFLVLAVCLKPKPPFSMLTQLN